MGTGVLEEHAVCTFLVEMSGVRVSGYLHRLQGRWPVSLMRGVRKWIAFMFPFPISGHNIGCLFIFHFCVSLV